MLFERDDEETRVAGMATAHGTALLLLGLSVSLDELAIGFTLGLLRLPIVPVVVLIGVQAFALTLLGLRLGARLGESIREGAERLAGVALTLLALVLLGEKLAA
jgi:putative Mn2+ efflux pump MntP